MAERNTHFGFKDVAWEEKQSLVRGVFDRVASRYDLMNDVMSLGMHRLWKDRYVGMIRAGREARFLDVAGGTGDIAMRIHKRFGADVAVCDINAAMLSEGRDRLFDKGYGDAFTYICGNAESLPFEDSSRDVYTIAFGIRNVTDVPAALAEAYRVLAPGGQFLCLEFSPEVTPALKPVYDTYSFKLLPRFGEWIAKDRESYQYLAESIRRFPSPRRFVQMIQAAGFSRVKATPLSGGICYIHEAWKV